MRTTEEKRRTIGTWYDPWPVKRARTCYAVEEQRFATPHVVQFESRRDRDVWVGEGGQRGRQERFSVRARDQRVTYARTSGTLEWRAIGDRR